MNRRAVLLVREGESENAKNVVESSQALLASLQLVFDGEFSQLEEAINEAIRCLSDLASLGAVLDGKFAPPKEVIKEAAKFFEERDAR